jgi:ABC-type sugar transport system, periplasmic component
VATLIAVIIIVVAGCSSSGSGSKTSTGASSGATTSQAAGSSAGTDSAAAGIAWASNLLKQYTSQTVANFPRPTQAFSPGKHNVAMIAYNASSSTTANEYRIMKQVVSVIGWTAQPLYDGKLQASVEAASIAEALSRGAEALFLFSIKPQSVQNALEPALTKHMPVICMVCGEPSDQGNLPGVTIIQDSLTLGGQEAAAYIINDSHGKAKVTVFNDLEFPNVVDRLKATVAALKAHCPGCTVTESNVIESQAIAPGTPSFLGYLSAHPKGQIDYIVCPYDAAASVWAPAAAQAGRSEIKMVGYFNSPPFSNYIAAGSPATAAASIAVPLTYYEWAAVDVAARLLNKLPTWNTGNLPNALITHANAAEFAASAKANNGEPSIDPTFDVESYFKKMWMK